MSTKPDGGPAYPQVPIRTDDGMVVTIGAYVSGFDDMSLRDWFAGQALVGILSNDSLLYRIRSESIMATVHDAAADFALEVADAMLKARKK